MRLVSQRTQGVEDLRGTPLPAIVSSYPQLRFMGSKHRLLPWIHRVLSRLQFSSAIDAFSGTGCVGFLLRSMGKRVVSNDALRFAFHVANAGVANPGVLLAPGDVARLVAKRRGDGLHFIEDTFRGIFFTDADNQFLDRVWTNLRWQRDPVKRSIAIASLCRAAIKKQPRGVFTVSGLDGRYDDGRRDLKLSMEEHFIESVRAFNAVVSTDDRHRAVHGDVFDAPEDVDLAYLDPPYVPRADDNCYIKRYHFLEGLSCYWRGLKILDDSKVKKIEKRFTPFSYRRTAVDAFDRLFRKFRRSTIVLSYSSNGFPDRDVLIDLLKRYKRRVEVFENAHRYHFGTHASVSEQRAVVREFLFVAR